MVRPQIKGVPRKPKRYLRKAVAYETKQRCISLFEKSAGKNDDLTKAINTVFGPQESSSLRSLKKQVRKWLANKVYIYELCAQGRGAHFRHRPRGVATVLTPTSELEIVAWVNALRRDGIPVSLAMLSEKALEVAKELSISREQFRASHSWAKKFMRRHRLSIRARTRQGQTTPSDAREAARAFAATVRQTIVENGVTKFTMRIKQVHNVFECNEVTGPLTLTFCVAVFFEYLPRRTLAARNSKTVWVKCGGKDKERVTAMLLADSIGKKYPLFLIFKSKPSKRTAVGATNKTKQNGFGRTIWSEVKPLQATTGCQIYGNATAWWTAEMSMKFLHFHFANREAPDERVLLLWDDFSCHWTEEVVQYARSIGVVLVKVPPRYTFVCQPADISWNKPLKDVLRKRWVQNLQEQIAEFHTLVEQQKREAAQARARADEDRRQASIEHGVMPRDVACCPGFRGSPTLQTVSPRCRAPAPAPVPEWVMRSGDASDSSEPNSDAERLAARVPRRRRQQKKKNGFELVAPKRRHIIVWIAEAWKALTKETIVSGFGKAGLLNDTRCCGENGSISPGDVGEILDKLRDMQVGKLELFVPSTLVMTQPASTRPRRLAAVATAQNRE